MNDKELKKYQKLINKQLIKKELKQFSIDELKLLNDEIKKKLMNHPLLKIEHLHSQTFFISGNDIRSKSDIIERELLKYGEGGIDYYSDYEYDCFIFTFMKKVSSNLCEKNLNDIILRLTEKCNL